MKIKREIETASARYNIEDLNNEQFNFLVAACHHYCSYTCHCIPDKESVLGELIDKLEKMRESSVTIIG